MRDKVGCVVKRKSARKEATFVVLEPSKLNCHNFDHYLMSVTLDLRCCNVFERFTYSWWAYLPGTKVFADSKVYVLMTACLISTCILITDANAMSKGSGLYTVLRRIDPSRSRLVTVIFPGSSLDDHHLLDSQCFEFWFGGLQKSSQHLLCYLELTMPPATCQFPDLRLLATCIRLATVSPSPAGGSPKRICPEWLYRSMQKGGQKNFKGS
ncbi:hypothetical protein ARMGADRAFT_1040936 [Armillaria gallica]|uniref:Uncharacterized protein n=1 Tax=Armillaria gallica TaxID=47427 RepID=A0A2H3CVC8_ARMGA|nr:hypothetical protein ARMGADRAFT_1040936 [Armillaria gallica]